MKFCGVLFTMLANISCRAIKRYIFLKNTYCKTLWKNIWSGWERFSHCIRFEVGNAWCTQFWHHVWFGEIPLKEAFPALFQTAQSKETHVVDLICWNNGGYCVGCYLYKVTSWLGVGGLQAFFYLLYSNNIDQQVEDRICWVPEKSGFFAIKSYYKILTIGCVHSFPWRSIWRSMFRSSGFITVNTLFLFSLI